MHVGVEPLILGIYTTVLKMAFTYGLGVVSSRGEMLRMLLGRGIESFFSRFVSADEGSLRLKKRCDEV